MDRHPVSRYGPEPPKRTAYAAPAARECLEGPRLMPAAEQRVEPHRQAKRGLVRQRIGGEYLQAQIALFQLLLIGAARCAPLGGGDRLRGGQGGHGAGFRCLRTSATSLVLHVRRRVTPGWAGRIHLAVVGVDGLAVEAPDVPRVPRIACQRLALPGSWRRKPPWTR